MWSLQSLRVAVQLGVRKCGGLSLHLMYYIQKAVQQWGHVVVSLSGVVYNSMADLSAEEPNSGGVGCGGQAPACVQGGWCGLLCALCTSTCRMYRQSITFLWFYVCLPSRSSHLHIWLTSIHTCAYACACVCTYCKCHVY
jgi:hypothetical protein